jgi:predicted ribonuclease YlaK
MSKNKRLKNKKIKFQEKPIDQPQKKDQSPNVHQRNKIAAPLTIINRELTEKQKKFIELAMDKQVKLLLVSGPAGTTKTYLAVLASLMLMNEKKISANYSALIFYLRSIKILGSLIYRPDLAPYNESPLGYPSGTSNRIVNLPVAFATSIEERGKVH